MRGNMKGQLTAVNLVAVFISLIVYVAILPTLQSSVDTGVAALLLSPNPYTGITVLFLRLFPFFVILGIVLTAISYANPHREGVPG